uniref:Uncharacterized protein n=1 Tax=Globodera rostochiensis TaxID=31243 RepID=A0A914GVN7_GLORO
MMMIGERYCFWIRTTDERTFWVSERASDGGIRNCVTAPCTEFGVFFVSKIMASFNAFAWESFFFGKLERSEAERLMANCESGTFLIRESSTAQSCFSLCVKGEDGHFLNYLIEKLEVQASGGLTQYRISTQTFADMPSLLNHFKVHNVSAGPTPIKLLKPLEKPFLDKVMAKYKFEPERISDLPFESGELLEILGKPEHGWWLARNCLRETGMIPANRVKPCDDCDDELSVLNPSTNSSSITNEGADGLAGNRSSAHSVGEQQQHQTAGQQQQKLQENSWVVVKVGRQPSIYDSDSLSIKQGQLLYLQEILSNGMCRGANENGKVGLFPITFVEPTASNIVATDDPTQNASRTLEHALSWHNSNSFFCSIFVPIEFGGGGCFGTMMDDFEYITANVAGPGTDAAVLEEDFEGCDCAEGKCTSSTNADDDKCRCLPGKMDNYNPITGKWMHGIDSAEAAHLECHQNCKCAWTPEQCANRQIQYGVRQPIRIAPCANGKGVGVFASALIETGRFVVEYVGEVIGEEEARRRIGTADAQQHNYLFTIREFIQGECRSTFIDARHKGNISRFINHSCEPNLALQVVRLGRQCPSLAMFASRDIQPGEELSYSYGFLAGADAALSGKACLCGASTCMGRLPSASTI